MSLFLSFSLYPTVSLRCYRCLCPCDFVSVCLSGCISLGCLSVGEFPRGEPTTRKIRVVDATVDASETDSEDDAVQCTRENDVRITHHHRNQHQQPISYTSIHASLCIHACLNTDRCMPTHTNIYTYTHKHRHIHTNIDTYVYVTFTHYIDTFNHSCLQVHAHTHTHTHTHGQTCLRA